MSLPLQNEIETVNKNQTTCKELNYVKLDLSPENLIAPI